MKNIEGQNVESGYSHAVRKYNPQVKKSKVTRIHDSTPTFANQTEINPKNLSFRDKVLEELDFLRYSSHEVSKKDWARFRIADPITFRMCIDWGEYTHVRINFYARKYTVEVAWLSLIQGDHCLTTATLTLEYAQEKTANSGIKMVKDFLLSTMDDLYREYYLTYLGVQGIKQ